MIVDAHTHTPTHVNAVPKEEERWATVNRPDRAVKMTTSYEEYFEAMRPVDRAICFGIAMLHEQLSVDVNNAVAALAAASNGKVIGFMSVHADDPNALDEMERAYHELGLRGLKLGPNYQNFDPVGENACKVYAKAQEMGLPVVFHQGTSPVQDAPIRYAHPLVMDEIAMRFPDLKIVMAHLAHPWLEDCLVVVRKHPNVYADVSARYYRPWSFYNGMRYAYEWAVMDKLLFGTDYPVSTPQENINGLRGLNNFARKHHLPEVPQELLEGIIHRDTLTLLGLS